MSQPLLGAMRSHACGGLRAVHAGEEVRLAGWVARRRDHGGLVFLDLRDASGVVQVVVHPEQAPEAAAAAHEVRTEDCVRTTGMVFLRPAGNENPELPTGEVEVIASDLEVLARSDTPPFPLEGRVEVDEVLRLRHRYLDLRRPAGRRALAARARTNAVLRRVLEERGFLEVETPYLTRSTPEGARDFLVPTHLQPGQFYALPQSPQLFKQLLMVAGVERYYQIVRCFRDEALRAERQPEFTQLDIELSFLDEEDLYALSEELMAAVWREVLDVEVPTPFPRMSCAEAMRRFGSDKPDLRYGMELVDLGQVFSGTGRAGLRRAARAGPGDLVLLVADRTVLAQTVLGELRTRLAAERGLVPEGRWAFLWVTDFPMFEWDAQAGRWDAIHHPFTSPAQKWEETFPDTPAEATARAYDLVLNGVELGGGSIRIHRAEVQRKVFDLLGIGPEEAEQKFGFLLRGLSFGAPPHGGIAFGLDRVVSLALGADSIREVIAFPKTQSGSDPLTGAPTEVAEEQLAEVLLKALPKP